MSNEGNYGIAKNSKKTSIKFGKNSNIYVSTAEKGSAIKHINGGPEMSDSTKGAKLNSKQSKATKGKKRI